MLLFSRESWMDDQTQKTSHIKEETTGSHIDF